MDGNAGSQKNHNCIVVGIERKENNCIHGSCGEYQFYAKVFDIGSEHGIDGGRVSKLWISRHEVMPGYIKKTVIANYDRGWDIRPKTEDDFIAYLSIIHCLEKLPLDDDGEASQTTQTSST